MNNRYIGTVARMGGVPAILSEFVDSFADLIQWNTQYLCNPGERIFYPRPAGLSIHDVARNRMAEGMRGDWLLMLDSDHSFEPDLTARLINVADGCGADVVTGFYQYRSYPHSPVLYLDRDDTPTPVVDWDEDVTALDIAAAGAGCLWVNKSVFQRIHNELKEEPFSRIGGMGEDHSFFHRIKKLGIKAVAAMQVECHHLQVRPLSAENYVRGVFEASEPEPVQGYR
jgi:hypothetical protein